MLLTEIDTVNLLSLSLIFLIGLPHGSFDLAIVMGIVNHKTLSKITYFIFSYIGLGVIVIITWLLAPQFSLIVFLIISVIHFGLGDTANSSIKNISNHTKMVQVYLMGALLFLLPLYQIMGRLI